MVNERRHEEVAGGIGSTAAIRGVAGARLERSTTIGSIGVAGVVTPEPVRARRVRVGGDRTAAAARARLAG